MKSKFTRMYSEAIQLDGKLHVKRNPTTGVHMMYCNNKSKIEEIYSKLNDIYKSQLAISYNESLEVWNIRVSTRHILNRMLEIAEQIDNA